MPHHRWKLRAKLTAPLFAVVILGSALVAVSDYLVYRDIKTRALPVERELARMRRLAAHSLSEYRNYLMTPSNETRKHIAREWREFDELYVRFAQSGRGGGELGAFELTNIQDSAQVLKRHGDRLIRQRDETLDGLERLESSETEHALVLQRAENTVWLELQEAAKTPQLGTALEDTFNELAALTSFRRHMLAHLSKLREMLLVSNEARVTSVAELEQARTALTSSIRSFSRTAENYPAEARFIEPLKLLAESVNAEGRRIVGEYEDFLKTLHLLEDAGHELQEALNLASTSAANDTQALLKVELTRSAGAITFLLLATLGISWSLTRRLTKRIDAISHASEAFGGGDLNARAPSDGADELAALAMQFNAMADKVKSNVAQAHDLTQRLSHQASHDMLTGLVNRREFERRLQRVLTTAHREKTENALCYLDLDQFKVVNDTCGHIAGDELLRQLGNLLRGQLRISDTLARLGGDEFGVLMENCALDQAERVSTKLRQAVEDFRFQWNGASFNVAISIGVSPITEMTGSTAEVLRTADSACFAAKDGGRNRVHVYRENDSDLIKRHGEMSWVGRICQALDEDRFQLFAQAIVPINSPVEGMHYEVLVRMEDEQGQLVPPGSFLPAAERYGLSNRLDRWVICAVFEWLAQHPDHMERTHLCAINLSCASLVDVDFLSFVTAELTKRDIPASKICFEITETVAIANLSTATELMLQLKQLGCRFALDDFGSGLSSFGYLKNLPVDLLKIDGMFVKDLLDDPANLAMVKAIHEIGHATGKRTVAEFVENNLILERLRELGVDYGQGYGIAKPRPLGEALDDLCDRAANVAA